MKFNSESGGGEDIIVRRCDSDAPLKSQFRYSRLKYLPVYNLETIRRSKSVCMQKDAPQANNESLCKGRTTSL